MANATFSLPNGTVVTVEGSPEEIDRVLQMYAGRPGKRGTAVAPAAAGKDGRESVREETRERDLVPAVVNQIKSSELAEAIEEKILDARSQLNRILLPLYVIHAEMDNAYALTSGEIAKVTRELGAPVGQPDVSKILAGEASRYVLGDAARVRGRPVRYKLSRRGVQYVADVLGSGRN